MEGRLRLIWCEVTTLFLEDVGSWRLRFWKIAWTSFVPLECFSINVVRICSVIILAERVEV